MYKASFRCKGLAAGFDNKKALLLKKKALLFISVGQRYHEGDKFRATVELINRYDFEVCDIVLADTLQRYNHIGRLGEEAAFAYSLEQGSAWLDRNHKAIVSLDSLGEIRRWDYFLRHPDYLALRRDIESAYKKNTSYREAIHANVSSYMNRLIENNLVSTQDELFYHGVSYLIEECPIVMPLWASLGYDFIIYPKPVTPAMDKTHDLFVKDVYPAKCRWLHLRFKKTR